MNVSVAWPDFEQRLAVARQTLAVRLILSAALWIATLTGAGAAMLVIADYWFELPVSSRTGGLVFLSAVALLAAIHLGGGIRRRISRIATAREIERQFPQLGQAPRTHVQFASLSNDQIEGDGVDSRLVQALALETNHSTQTIDLTEHFPWRRLVAPLVAAVLPVVCFMWFGFQGGEWRTAVRRCLTLQGSYTTIAVQPGPEFVLAGEPLTVTATVTGRPVSVAELQYRRRSSQDAWRPCLMQPSQPTPSGTSANTWTATLDSVNEPLDYRVVADDGVSRELTVDLRPWLRLESLQARVRPPAFTGVAEFTSTDGNVQAPEGSDVELTIQVDRDALRADLVLLSGDEVTSRLPLDVQGRTARGSLVVSRSHAYQIEAITADGSPLAANRLTIEVQRNQPPTVALEDVPPVLEMNPIAELETRLKVHDEFGVSKYGIVYWVNAEDPKTLLLRDTSNATAPVRDIAEATNLLLEELALDQHDSVTYFAFAEDNTPGAPQRTETDPSFLDIRPFRRVYLPGGQCNGGGRCLSIDELISRERSNFTRSFRAAAAPTEGAPTAAELSPVVRYELSTADMTRRFAQGAEAFLGDDVQYIYQAEAAMRRAATLLMQADARAAKEEQSQAVHRLILARDTVLTKLCRNSAGAGQFIKFDHRERQKMRRPTDDEELIAEIVDQLRRLAATENVIQRRLAGRDRKAWDLADHWSDRPPTDELARQQEAVAESAEAMHEFGQSRDDLSSVARDRLQEASRAARQAAEQLTKREHESAAETAADAALMLREAADQIEGQLSNSLARRLEAARSLSELMTRRMEELANLAPGDGQSTTLPGRGKKTAGQSPPPSSPRSPVQTGAMARGGSRSSRQAATAQLRQASRLSDSTQALDDLLKSLAQQRTLDAESASNAVRQLSGEELPEQARQALHRFRERAAAGEADPMQAEARIAAAAMRSLSSRLDRIRQSVVQRQLDRVRAAEQRARALEQRLNAPQSPRAADEWLKDVQLFSAELGELGEHDLAVKLNEQLFREGAANPGDFTQYGIQPGQIGGAFREILAVLQARAQRESLHELKAGAPDVIPAEYEAYVERYYQVLSQNASP